MTTATEDEQAADDAVPGASRRLRPPLRVLSSGDALGARIRRLRVGRRLSVRGLAVRLECDHSLVVRWEGGEREPAPQDLARLARVMGVDADELLAGAELEVGRVASSRSHARSTRERLGADLRARRTAAGFGLWDVYASTGVDGRRLRAVEDGADPSLAELRDLAHLYGASVDEVLAALVRPPRSASD